MLCSCLILMQFSDRLLIAVPSNPWTTLLLAGAAIEALGDDNLPITQVALSYATILIVYGVVTIHYREGLHAKWYAYLVLGLVDSMAFFCVVYGMRFTSVTSMGVLASSGVISSIPLTQFVFRGRFRFPHYAGVVLTTAGIILLVVSDKTADSSGPHVVFGDAILILGNFLYALSSIILEKVLKTNIPVYEALTMMSAFGCLSSVVGLVVAGEYKHFVPQSTRIAWLFASVVVGEFVIYTLCAPVLAWSGTTVEQISFLSTAVWAVPVRLLFFGGFGSEWWIFLISVFLTVVGILVYIAGGDVYAASSSKNQDLVCPASKGDLDEHEPYRPLDQAPIL